MSNKTKPTKLDKLMLKYDPEQDYHLARQSQEEEWVLLSPEADFIARKLGEATGKVERLKRINTMLMDL